MTAVLWTPQAREDLQAAYDYIAKDFVRYADLVVSEIVSATGRLEHFPEAGRIVPELNRPEIREVLWRSYRIVYRLTPDRKEAHLLTGFRSERSFPLVRGVEGGPA